MWTGYFDHRVVTLVADNWRVSGYERFALVLNKATQEAAA